MEGQGAGNGAKRRRVWFSRQRWILLGIILLAFLLRAYNLAQREFWFDEVLSAVIAGKGVAGIIAYTQETPFEHPPLYYLFLSAWMHLAGISELALRFFSLFWGVLLIPLLYRFMVNWGGRFSALLVALVAALFPSHIAHSHSARMYTLLPVLGVLLLFCFFRALETRRRRWWVAFLFVTIVGVTIHYYFALLLLVPTVFLLLSGPRYRRLLVPLVAVQLGFVMLIAGWIWLSPGFRESIQQVLAGEGGGVSSLELRIAHTAGRLLLDDPALGYLALAVLALLGAIFWPLPPPPRNHPVSLLGSRRFVLIWLFVPWLAALAIPYWLQNRHLVYLWPAYYALIAAGLLALQGRSKLLFVAGLLMMLVTSGYWLYQDHNRVEFEFGRIMTFIESRALPDDLVVMNQPAFWPFAEYYPHRGLPQVYVPDRFEPASEETVEERLRSLTSQRSRLWLGPVGAWTADPDSLVEQWLATRAFQAFKAWFPGSGSAALYFTANSLEPLAIEGGIEWEDRIRLLMAQGSSGNMAPGDGMRLSLTWEALQPIGSSYLVSILLVDEKGQIWAERQSEPCSGWCPTDSWGPGEIVDDRHALWIPPGTPPGSYRLMLVLLDPNEGRELVASGWGPRVGLADVRVVEPEPLAAEALPHPSPEQPLQVAFGQDIVLVGYDLGQQVPAGGTLMLDLYWLSQAAVSEDYTLRLELVGPGDQPLASWERSPVADYYPTSQWQIGETLRGVQSLGIPPHVGPGRYELRVSLLDADGQPLPLSGSRPRQALGGLIHWQEQLGQGALTGSDLGLAALQVTEQPDRPHNFDLPIISQPLDAQLGQQVELLGYDLETQAAMPGGQIDLTLYWRGGGATDRPYKVFTHLIGDQPLPLAQHDGPPGAGCCPTDTWVEGEVVVDRHAIPLPSALPPGYYRLTAGMYDESSAERLPVLDQQAETADHGLDDQVFIAEVAVRSRSTPTPVPVLPVMTDWVYLPLVLAGGD